MWRLLDHLPRFVRGPAIKAYRAFWSRIWYRPDVYWRYELGEPEDWETKSQRDMREDFFEQTMPMLFGKGTRGLVLDAGCGSGSYFPPLLRHFDRVIGIDFVPYRAKFAKSRHRDAEVLVASLTHIPLRDGCVDAVWTAVVLLHIKFSDKSIALREFQRCLRSSGILALWEPVLQGNGMRLKHKSIDYLATLDWWRNQLPLMVLASHDIPGFWTLISARFGGVTELDSRKLILSSST